MFLFAVYAFNRRLFRVRYRKFSKRTASVPPSNNCIDNTLSCVIAASKEKLNCPAAHSVYFYVTLPFPVYDFNRETYIFAKLDYFSVYSIFKMHQTEDVQSVIHLILGQDFVLFHLSLCS